MRPSTSAGYGSSSSHNQGASFSTRVDDLAIVENLALGTDRVAEKDLRGAEAQREQDLAQQVAGRDATLAVVVGLGVLIALRVVELQASRS